MTLLNLTVFIFSILMQLVKQYYVLKSQNAGVRSAAKHLVRADVILPKSVVHSL